MNQPETPPSAAPGLAAARLAAIVESSADAIISKTLDGTILTWNQAAERVFGYTADEIIGKKVFVLIPPELHDEERDLLARLSRGERIEQFETRRRRKDGSVIPIELTVSPVLNESGTIIGAASIKRDISERKSNVQAAARLAAIVESSDDAIISKTLDGKVLTWNRAAHSMYGFSPEEMIGQSIFNVIPVDLFDDENRILAQVALGNHVAHYETRRVRRDRTEIDISLTISPLRNPDGTIVGASSIQRDITSQKRAEAAFRQEAKMESIGRLAGGLAHDFNNQLHVLAGLVNFILMDQGLGSESRADLAEIQKTHERMASMTRQLLAFARQQVLSPEIISLNGALSDTRTLLQRLIGSTISIDLDLEPDLRPVRVDHGQLVQVLMNLTINARDAMSRGGRLEISTRNRSLAAGELTNRVGFPIDAGDYVELCVADTGEGIPREHLPRIFEPFFTTKEVGQGTGLGLATVEGIVAQSNGHIMVESQIGTGTTFQILIPAADHKEEINAVKPPPMVTEGQGSVMVVDDEKVIRVIMSRLLKQRGYQVVEAENGKEGLNLLAGGANVDVIISDITMPVMAGPEFGVALAESYPDIPVLWISGHPLDTRLPPSRLDQPFLQKPVPPETLIQVVDSLIQQRGKAVSVSAH